MRHFKRITFFSLGVLLIGLSGCGQRIANIDSRGTNIICFGDSITKGEGASEGGDYPSVLAAALGLPVINAGVSGETTEGALRRIEVDVLERDPRLAIVEFSANDFLRNIPRQETFENLDRIVELIQEKGAMVVLVEVAAGLYFDEYIDGFKKIAEKRHALLIPNILKGILTKPSLKSDEIHPNDAGYRIIAERICEKVRPLLKE